MVVLSDTHRADFAPPLGAAHPLAGERPTPHLELLARDGVTFLEAFTPVPISAPSYATLLSGEPPARHGLLNNHQHLTAELPLLPERLRAAGWATAAAVSNPFCSAAHGFGRGFDHFWDEVEGRGKEGRHVTDAAIAWLGSRPRDRPFFLFVAYMDAHTPFLSEAVPPSLLVTTDGEPCCVLRAENAHVENRVPLRLRPGRNRVTFTYLEDLRPAQPPDDASPLHCGGLRLADERFALTLARGFEPVPTAPEYRRFDHRAVAEIVNPTGAEVRTELLFRCHRLYDHDEYRRFYLAGVRSFDRELGRLLGHLRQQDLYRDAVVVFLSDHGEMLGEHRAWGHVDSLYDEALRIPLVVKAPGLEPGSEHRGRFALRDLPALVWALASGEAGPEERFPFVADRRDLLSATFPPEAGALRVSLRRGALKLIADADGGVELYDLERDPGEASNLWAERARDPEVRSMTAVLRDELDRLLTLESLDLDSLTAEQREQLRGLGYLD